MLAIPAIWLGSLSPEAPFHQKNSGRTLRRSQNIADLLKANQ